MRSMVACSSGANDRWRLFRSKKIPDGDRDGQSSEGEMPLQALPDETARSLSSAQAVISPDAALKELVENALDAGAGSIQVRVKDAGLALLSVRDDGGGVAASDMPLLLMPHTTSKIASIRDLAHVRSFGFRGEALNSIATLSSRTVVYTRTSDENTGRCYEFDRSLKILSETTKALQRGTLIEFERLFQHVPVRKQVFAKNAAQICKRMRNVIIGFALLRPEVRMTLKFERSTAKGSSSDDQLNGISKSPVASTMDAIRTIFGGAFAKALDQSSVQRALTTTHGEFDSRDEEARLANTTIRIEAVLPHRDARSQAIVWRSNTDHIFIYINNRRVVASGDVVAKEIVGRVRQRCAEGLLMSKYPFMWIHVHVPIELTDVNIEPDKTSVRFRFPDQIFACVDELLDGMYPSIVPGLDMQVVQHVAAESQSYAGFLSGLSHIATTATQDRHAGVGNSSWLPVMGVSTPSVSLDDADAPQMTQETVDPLSDSIGSRLLELAHGGNMAIDMSSWSSGAGIHLHDHESGQRVSVSSESVAGGGPCSVVASTEGVAKIRGVHVNGAMSENEGSPDLVMSSGPNRFIDHASAMPIAKATTKATTTNKAAMTPINTKPTSLAKKQPKKKAIETNGDGVGIRGTLDAYITPTTRPAQKLGGPIRGLLVTMRCASRSITDIAARYKRFTARRQQRVATAETSRETHHQNRRRHGSTRFNTIGVLRRMPLDLATAPCTIVSHTGALWLINMPRLIETLLFDVLRDTFQVEPETLTPPIVLTPIQLGGPHIIQWMRSLPRDIQTGRVDNRTLLWNGFDVRFPVGDVRGVPVLHGLGTLVRALDIGDLREILDEMYKHAEDRDTSCVDGDGGGRVLRPEKTIRFFTDRACMLARRRVDKLVQSGSLASEAAVACHRLLKLRRGSEVLDPVWRCPHGRPLIARLGSIPDMEVNDNIASVI